jgi:hypothetical protein
MEQITFDIRPVDAADRPWVLEILPVSLPELLQPAPRIYFRETG